MKKIWQYGTRVRINKPGHEVHNRIAYINVDNWLEWLENPDLPLSYMVDVPVPSGDDINHYEFLASELVRMRQ